MANDMDAHGSVGPWAKSYYFAVRAAMESILRPYDLGSTQYYVLDSWPTTARRCSVTWDACSR